MTAPVPGGAALEFISMTLLGSLFLVFICLFPIDLLSGVGLMLSGHTHGGQIWPLSIATRMLNPLLAGRYENAGMTVLVSRGTGTWGPRMRLWHPGEIMLVTLRSR
jgi:hypothetical protein